MLSKLLVVLGGIAASGLMSPISTRADIPPCVLLIPTKAEPSNARYADEVTTKLEELLRRSRPVLRRNEPCSDDLCIARAAQETSCDGIIGATLFHQQETYELTLMLFSGETGRKLDEWHGAASTFSQLMLRALTQAQRLAGTARRSEKDSSASMVPEPALQQRHTLSADRSSKTAIESNKPQPRATSSAKSHIQNLLFFVFALTIVSSGFLLSYRSAKRKEEKLLKQLVQSRKAGLDLPPSLHPEIDPSRCIGCGNCVKACPDQSVLGVIEHRAYVVTPSHCVGHGLCKAVCPADAIRLVFGSQERPIDLPKLNDQFESNVSGIYVSGELGGMGLIANAFNQAIESVDNIVKSLRDSRTEKHDQEVIDLLIVGAGPAGLGAALRAQELGLNYRCVDQSPSWGGAIRSYPRAKLVMTRPLRVPLYGPVKLKDTSKEALISLWSEILNATQPRLEFNQRVNSIERRGTQFVVKTVQETIVAKRVLLAIGNRGTPRKLGVPGDELPLISYELTEPKIWQGKTVAVVGGGDVACETALALSAQTNTRVWMIYRGSSLSRPKADNRSRIEQAVQQKKIRLLLEASIISVRDDGLELTVGEKGPYLVNADHLVSCLGGQPPTEFLNSIGIEMVTLRGESLA